MADFCKQCGLDILGIDTKDLAGLTTVEDWNKGLAQVVLCEGCGPIQVDPEGNCVSANCDHAGTVGHGLPWKEQN